jgi:hypothetical protein
MDELSPPTSPSKQSSRSNNLPPRINRITSDMSSDMQDILSPTFDSACILQDDSFRSLGPSPQSSMGDGNYSFLSRSYSADSIIRRVEEEIAAARNAASSAKNHLSDRQQQQQQRQPQQSQSQPQEQRQQQQLNSFSIGSMGSGDEDMKAMLDVGVDIYVEDGLITAEVNSMLDDTLPQSSSMTDNYEKALDLFGDEFANGNGDDDGVDVDSENSGADEAIELVFSLPETSDSSDPFEDEDWQQPVTIVDSNSNVSNNILHSMEESKSTPLAPVIETQEEEEEEDLGDPTFDDDEQSIMRIQSSAVKELMSAAKPVDSDTTSRDAQMESSEAPQDDMNLKSNDTPAPPSFEATESQDGIELEFKYTPAEQPEEMESFETSGTNVFVDHDAKVEPSSKATELQDDINLKEPQEVPTEQPEDKEGAITSSTYAPISKPMETRDDKDLATNDAPAQEYEEKGSVQASGTNMANELNETESKGDKNLKSNDGPAQSKANTADDEKWLSEIISGDAVASDAYNAPAMHENGRIDRTNIALEIDGGGEQTDDLVNAAVEGVEENKQASVVSSPIRDKKEGSSLGASEGQTPKGADSAKPKRRGGANENVVKRSEKDLAGQSRRIRFRDPFPKLRMCQTPRDPLTVFDEHTIVPPIGRPRWTKPTRTLTQLINAVTGPSLQRRSNACGALKVLTTEKNNLKSLVRMDGFLSAMIFAVAEDVKSSEKALALDARTRAMTVLRNVCEPKENRVRVCTYVGLPECLMKVIREDPGEGLVLACGVLALLAKTPSCREGMARTKGLIDILAEVLSGEVPAPVVEPEEEKKDDDGEGSLSSEGSSVHDEDDDHSSHSGSSFSSEGSTCVDPSGFHANPDFASIRKRNEGMHDEFLQRARSNACAALLHLSKHCPVTVRIHRQIELHKKRNVHVYSPVYPSIASPYHRPNYALVHV